MKDSLMNFTSRPFALVVNDDPLQLRLTSALLEKDGVQVLPCLSTEEALRVMDKQGRLDLIITDLHMPGIDGWRFCRLLRSPNYAAFNQVPILVTSATLSGADAAEVTADLGANAFLPCPYKPAVLRAYVRDLLAGRRPQTLMSALIVEDSHSLAALLRRAFEAHGYTVHVAPTGAHAQQLFRQHTPEIVILDYHLPDMTGDQLLTECKQPGSPTVAIVMTSDESPERASQVMRCGADGFVRKPFDPAYLIDLCDKARRQRALLRVEELLEARTKELDRQRNEFLAMLTHDIKNPLGVVLGYAELLIEEVQEGDTTEAVDLLERLKSNALVVNSLVANYLDFSRSETGHLILTKRPVELNQLLQQVWRRYEAEARHRGVTLAFRPQPGLPLVKGDPLALERIFANLVHNALKFTPETGHVTLSVAQHNQEVTVAVADTGPGIAAHELATIFEKYRRAAATRHREGMGLGLFIVKTLVEAHAGRIEVHSTVGKGSCFTVFLPVALIVPAAS